MLVTLLPLVALSLATPDDTVVVTSPKAAQVRLADMLADADSVETVRARHHVIAFRIVRASNAFDLIVTTDRGGTVVGVVVRDRGHAEREVGPLTWLVATMKQTTAVTRLEVDRDGAVTLTVSDGTRYMAIPGSGGNAAVEARFAAAFDKSA